MMVALMEPKELFEIKIYKNIKNKKNLGKGSSILRSSKCNEK